MKHRGIVAAGHPKTAEAAVQMYELGGNAFDAVVGINIWQPYIVGFTQVGFQDGGPDGTIVFLNKDDLEAASTTFSSSRIFPGQSNRVSNSIDVGFRRPTGIPNFAAHLSRKWATSNGMSSRRSRCK